MKKFKMILSLLLIIILLFSGCINENQKNTKNKKSEFFLYIENLSSDTINVTLEIKNVSRNVLITHNLTILSNSTNYELFNLYEGNYYVSVIIDINRNYKENIYVHDIKTSWKYIVYNNRIEKATPPPL